MPILPNVLSGQKRKEATPSQSRAKAKVADPVGSKRKLSKGAEVTQSPVKAKMSEQTGEKRKADSDAEDVEDAGPGSPSGQRAAEDEELKYVTTALHSNPLHNILQLHSDSKSDIAAEAGKYEMKAMDLNGFDIDNVANREKITEWVRERKPAFIIGRPQNRSVGQIRSICGFYQLQVREERWFVHEQLESSVTWRMEEVVGLKEWKEFLIRISACETRHVEESVRESLRIQSVWLTSCT